MKINWKSFAALLMVAIGALDPYMNTLPQYLRIILIVVGAVAVAYLNPPTRRAATRRGGSGARAGSLLALSFVGLAVLSACGAARAIYGASLGIGEAITIKRDIAAQAQLDAEDERQITQGLLDANTALLQVTDTAECFTEYTSDVKTNVLRGIDAAATSLDNLNNSGTLRIKNPKPQERFRRKIFYASLTAKGLRTALELIPAKEAGTEQLTLSEEQQRKLDELRALCRKAGVQLRKNETRLREDLARLESSSR